MRNRIKTLYVLGAIFMVMASNKLIALPDDNSFVLAYCLWLFWLGSMLATWLLLKKLDEYFAMKEQEAKDKKLMDEVWAEVQQELKNNKPAEE